MRRGSRAYGSHFILKGSEPWISTNHVTSIVYTAMVLQGHHGHHILVKLDVLYLSSVL